MFDLHHCNPWRPVDAWWQRATNIMERGEPSTSVDRDSGPGCRWIKQAQRFQFALREAVSYPQQKQLIVDFPAIYFAHRFLAATSAQNLTLRSGIEARILARQSDSEIAQANGCRTEVIEAYEALFFNVRSRLNRRDFILNSVLGLTHDQDLTNQQGGRLWKLVGYLGGPHVLDAVISRASGATWVHSPDGVPGFFQNLAIGTMKFKAAIAALSVPVNGSTQLQLLEGFVKYIEVERSTDSVGQANDQIQEHLQAMLRELPFQAIGIDNEKQLPDYDIGVAELRSDELMLAAAGLPVPGLDSLNELRFPEPPQR